MSLISISSPKHCGKQGKLFHVNHKFYKRLLFGLSSLLAFIAALILVLWVILRPGKPEFSVKELDVYQLNFSDPVFLSSSIDLTILSKNPNQKVGIYYYDLQVYATYKGQQITVHNPLPSFYQGHRDSNLLTASLVGSSMPVSSSFRNEVERDQVMGQLVLSLKVNGKLRWKVGTWVSGPYRVFVNCVAVVSLRGDESAGPVSPNQGSHCSISI